jgi:hypothetical protein
MSCQLKPSASAFSAMLSAFVGSVINGLSSGWFVAFMTGWISWFALFRVILGAVYMMYRSVTGTWEPEYDAIRQLEDEGSHPMIGQINSRQDEVIISGDPPSESHQGYSEPQSKQSKPRFLNIIWPSPSDIRAFKLYASKATKNGSPWSPLNQDVTFLGWVGWIWAGLIAPIAQLLWVAANISNRSNGAVKIVKGLTVAVTALPLCIDSRVRYGEALAGSGNRRSWAKRAFNLTNSLSCLLQGVICTILLITGAINLNQSSTFGFPTPIFALYPIFSLIWMYGSLIILPVRDGGRRRAAQDHWSGYILDVGMGAFAGIFLAAPAFGLYQSTSFDEKYGDFDSFSGSTSSGADGQTLTEYLQCEASVWKKVAAIFP